MPYQPITKDLAAEILSVLKRTINNLLAAGTLPQPAYIGRRLYWHPDIFYAWLDHQLNVPGTAITTTAPRVGQEKRRGRPR